VSDVSYRGRLAPSPTGLLHLGHARTFWMAQQRAREHQGCLILRSEDLDASRVRPEFREAMLEDLRWFGLRWEEGPDCGGPVGPYEQSARQAFYEQTFHRLLETGLVYACQCTRKDIRTSIAAPHGPDEDPIYPGHCRPRDCTPITAVRAGMNYRFRVPPGEVVEFVDGRLGTQRFEAGRDFGDFIVWRADGTPAYQLAVVADDHAMRITEVVRGEDLLLSTARQLLLYRVLGYASPKFFHCPLMTDETGRRLAKRTDALSLRALREQGRTPESLLRKMSHDHPSSSSSS